MKATSPYATLRALGMGSVAGCVGGTVLGLVYVHGGPSGFYVFCLAVGFVSWGMAEFLDRRARRQQQRNAEKVS